MIPKIIHYCWFGRGEKPKLAKKCIESWKKFCPDYKIIEWNEDNYDVRKNKYIENAYDNKKYAFVSDFARLDIIKNNGGIYFDTDVELIKNIDFLLQYDFFAGFENSDFVASGLGFGSIANGKLINAMFDEYKDIAEQTTLIGCPKLNTSGLVKEGVILNGQTQIIENNIILGIDVMNPYNYINDTMTKTENTISIHWFGMSWMSNFAKFKSKIGRKLKKFIAFLKDGRKL